MDPSKTAEPVVEAPPAPVETPIVETPPPAAVLDPAPAAPAPVADEDGAEYVPASEYDRVLAELEQFRAGGTTAPPTEALPVVETPPAAPAAPGSSSVSPDDISGELLVALGFESTNQRAKDLLSSQLSRVVDVAVNRALVETNLNVGNAVDKRSVALWHSMDLAKEMAGSHAEMLTDANRPKTILALREAISGATTGTSNAELIAKAVEIYKAANGVVERVRIKDGKIVKPTRLGSPTAQPTPGPGAAPASPKPDAQRRAPSMMFPQK